MNFIAIIQVASIVQNSFRSSFRDTYTFNGDKAAAEAHLTKLINEQGFLKRLLMKMPGNWQVGARKFDLIRWNLLSAKIDEFKESYRNAVNNGSYPAKIYYKFKEDNFTIDVTTFNYNEPVGSRLL